MMTAKQANILTKLNIAKKNIESAIDVFNMEINDTKKNNALCMKALELLWNLAENCGSKEELKAKVYSFFIESALIDDKERPDLATIQKAYYKFAAENAKMLDDLSISGVLSADTIEKIKDIADGEINEVLSILSSAFEG